MANSVLLHVPKIVRARKLSVKNAKVEAFRWAPVQAHFAPDGFPANVRTSGVRTAVKSPPIRFQPGTLGELCKLLSRSAGKAILIEPPTIFPNNYLQRCLSLPP